MPTDDVTQRPPADETPTLHVAVDGAREDRFTPGTLILGRYRVINLLGQGGMGVVYRADDLKLGQQVALKFIPRELLADPRMLRMLLSEVRIGREVSHPNVCRLYDVVDYEGDHFIAMQFVDGENLASLLRRIGRLPVEKAIDIMRDLAAGLAAAHERGVIHRDLKPANVMIDGRGRAHITDFGLAIVSGDPQRRGLAGTPVYMAPEQLSGDEVTTASDVYALGLILWEMLSGRRMYDAGSIHQIAQAHNEPKPRLTSSIRDLPPRIDQLIVQCLEEEPVKRPQSAAAVLALLPGGDPLAAAVAAGETPSPELVAAASKSGTVPRTIALGALAVFLAMLSCVAWLTPRATLFSSRHFRKSPDVLIDRAEEIVHASGIAGEPADHAGWFVDRARSRQEPLSSPDRLTFLYRRSTSALNPRSISFAVDETAPPLRFPGMANVEMTAGGRLLSFVAVPRTDAAPAPRAIDEMFRAAGLDRAQFHSVPPRLPAPLGSDLRFAWDRENVHVEAATFRGAPVWFEVNPLEREQRIRPSIIGLGGLVWSIVYVVLMALALALAIVNVRRGRGDSRGAWRASIVVTLAALAQGIFLAHMGGTNYPELVAAIGGTALFQGASFYIAYLGVEPYARRNWPMSLISWQRLIDMRWRDALVARDIGIGAVTGIFSILLTRMVTVATTSHSPPRSAGVLASMSSLTATAEWVMHAVPEAVLYGLWSLLLLVSGMVFLRRSWLYMPLFVIAIGLAISPRTGSTAGDLACGALHAVLLVVCLRTGGILAATFSWFCYHVPDGLPLTLDSNAWFAGRALFLTAILIGIAVYSAITASSSGPGFRRRDA